VADLYDNSDDTKKKKKKEEPGIFEWLKEARDEAAAKGYLGDGIYADVLKEKAKKKKSK
jgi:hypothetical protein